MKRLIITSIYTCFVLLNVLPVDACTTQPEDMTCCAPSCCDDEPMDCCVIDSEDNTHANDHNFTSQIKLDFQVVESSQAVSLPLEVLSQSEEQHQIFIERPPPESVKPYIAFQQLILYA